MFAARISRQPHAWVKLWKHHAAQPEADQINETARKIGDALLDPLRRQDPLRMVFPKASQILDEAPRSMPQPTG